MNESKRLMTAAALATLNGDKDAVAKTEFALIALKAERGKETGSPTPLQASACKSVQPIAGSEAPSREVSQ